MKPRSLGITFLFVVSVFMLLSTQAFATVSKDNQADALVFGVAPGGYPEGVVKQWGPIVKYLTRKTGLKIRTKIAASNEEFERQLSVGTYDFVYLNPYMYTIYNKSRGYLAFAKERDKKVKGIIVVRKDSPYKTLEDLKGQTVAFPKEDAFAETILPRSQFEDEAIPYKQDYVNSSTSVYRAVYKGDTPAGGGVMRTYNNLNPVVNGNLRVLWKTKQYTPHAFAAHPRISKKSLEKVQSAMVDMNQDPRGFLLLNNMQFKGIDVAQDKEWDDIRELQIDLAE